MYGGFIESRPAFGGHIQVQKVVDIEYLIKESEILTGRRGRKFVIYGGADRLVYRIQWHQNGYEVQRLNEDDNPIGTMHLMPEMLEQHCLCEALRAGRLFTPSVTH